MDEHEQIGQPAEDRPGGGRRHAGADRGKRGPAGPVRRGSGVATAAERVALDEPGGVVGLSGSPSVGLGGGRPGWASPRRPRGPRPVRPAVVPVIVRPAPLPRPALRVVPEASGQRLLVRRSLVVLPAPGPWVRARRVLAAAALTVVAASVVVGLGLLAGASAESRAVGGGLSAGEVSTTVTVGPEATVWDLARTVAPAASGPELAAVTERMVTDNSLTSVRLHPGQVLRVTAR
ncbi:MAG: hypothetical protein QOI36_2519 [Pseudonocardiales bacterium]|nr:hypothetical protein [Pseudonocardiales bacterium]